MRIFRQIRNFLIFSNFLLSFATFGLSQNFGIETTETVEIGGIKQVMSIKGKDSTKPQFLLHQTYLPQLKWHCQADNIYGKRLGGFRS